MVTPTRRAICLGSVAIAASLFSVSPSLAEDPVRIGVLVGTSGASAQIGNWTNRGVEIAVDQLNEAAGKKRFQIYSEDSEYKAQKGLEGFNKLSKVNNIQILIGSGSAVLPTIAPLADDQKILVMNVGAQTPKMAGIGKFTFSVLQLADFDIQVIAKYAFDKGLKKGAVLYLANDIGKTNAAEFEKQFKGLGGTLTATESFRATDTNYGPQLAKISASSPDFVYLVGDVDVAAAATRQIKALMPKVQILTYGGMESQLFLNAAGQAAEGMLYTQTDFDPASQDPTIKELATRYEAKYKEKLTSPFVGYAYDATMIAATALDQSKATGEPLRAAIMERRNFPGVTGAVAFRDDGTVAKAVVIKQVKDGKFELVTKIGVPE